MDRQRFLTAPLKIFGLVLIIGLCSCENNIETVNLITARDTFPLQSEQNATYVYNDSCKTKFKLSAPLIDTYGGKDPYQECKKGMVLDFYDDSSSVNSHVSANYSIRHENSKIMEADGNVIVINKKGDKLNTEQLFWDAGKHIIYTKKYVQIKTATEIIYGDGLQSNEDFSNYTITNIRGSITLNTPESSK
jgi:LPS export ABC transporter protein LptC